MKCGGALVVVSSAGQRDCRDLLPLLGGEARHEDVVRTRELPADLRDLDRRFPLAQHDFRESDAPQAIEVQRVVGRLHARDCMLPNR